MCAELRVTSGGTIAVSVDGDARPLGGARQRELLALLVLAERTPVSLDGMIEALWPDQAPATARKSVHRFVADIRRAFGSHADRIVTDALGYRLELRDGELDLEAASRAFDAANEQLRRGRIDLAADLLHEASARLGSLGAGVERESPSLERLARVREDLSLDIEELSFRADVDLGRHREVIGPLRAFVDAHPFREHAWGSLLLALYRSGRQRQALATHRELRTILRDALGVDPSPEIESIERAILEQTVAPPIAVVAARPTHVAEPPLGREDERRRVDELLDSGRLVSVVGTGGIGKTHLIESIVQQRAAGGTRSRFVSLGDGDAADLTAAIGAVIGTSPRPDQVLMAEIIDRLSSIDLLVIDNGELAFDAVRTFVVDLLANRSVRTTLLVGSRVPLGLSNEFVVRLGPLADGAAHAMLAATIERIGLDPTLGEHPDVERLRDLTDGLPLAIEIAGSMLQSMDPTTLADRWDAQPRAAMAAVLEHSLALLSADERRVLDHCAVFDADFDLAALEAVVGDDGQVVQAIDGLVRHSLIQVRHQRGSAGYRMLVPIREVARATSAPPNVGWEHRVVAHFVGVAGDALAQLTGADPADGVRRFGDALSGLRMAFELADADGDVSSMLSLAASLGLATGLSSATRGHSILRGWTERLLARAEDEPDLWKRAGAADALAWGHYGCGDGRWYQRVRALENSGAAVCAALQAIAAFSLGDVGRATTELADVSFETIDDAYQRAMLAGVSAVISFEHGLESGAALTDIAVRAAQGSSPAARFFASMACASHAFVSGDLDGMETHLMEMTETVADTCLVTLENMAATSEAMCLGLLTGRREPAPILAAVHDRYVQQNSLDPASVAMAIDTSILVLQRADDHPAAARLLGLADRLDLSLGLLSGVRGHFEAEVADTPKLQHLRMAGAADTTTEAFAAAATALRRSLDEPVDAPALS